MIATQQLEAKTAHGEVARAWTAFDDRDLRALLDATLRTAGDTNA